MTWTQHGEGVFSKRYRSLDLNIGAIVCEDGLLVVDTRAHHAQGRELIEDLKEISPLPVRRIINTHHHWDHTFGNGAFDDVDIWGHERCKTNLADYGQAMLNRVRKMAPDQAAEFDEVLIVPPNHTITEAADLTLGGRRVELRHLGRGHTDNDVVVRIPDAAVVFAGDLVEEGAPPSYGDAFTLEWPQTVTALLGLIDGEVVPGHGGVVDASFVAAQREALTEVARLARERQADGMTPQQAAAAGGPFPESILEQAFGCAWIQMGGGS